MATSPTGTVASDAAVAAIRRVVADSERLQSDVDGFTDLLTDDVVIVNFGGRRVFGRTAVRTAMQQALASPLADVTTTQEIEAVHFLRPDVALVSCVKHVHDGRGAAGSGSPLRERGMLTLVLVDRDGRWRIASAQTTPVAA
jgi:uncharacterized protein (TIGR02246 family)